MFNPDKNDYPQNAAGQPEFASIIVTLDGFEQMEGDDVVQKVVLSTQDVVTALAKLAEYFGEPTLLSNPQNANLLVEAGRNTNPVFVYATPRAGTIQVLTSTATWDMLVQHPDFGRTSTLLASEKLQDVIASQQDLLKQYAGGFANLMLLDLTPGDLAEGESLNPAAEQDPSGANEGNAAESLRDSAAVEQV